MTVPGKKQATKQHCGHSSHYLRHVCVSVSVCVSLQLFLYIFFFTDRLFLESRQVWDLPQLLETFCRAEKR